MEEASIFSENTYYEQNVGKNMDGKSYFEEVSVENRNMLLETARKILLSGAKNVAELCSCSSVS